MSFTFDNKSCLILIDIQKDYEKVYDFENFKKNIISLLYYARKNNILIIHIYEIDNKKSHWINFWQELCGKRKLNQGKPFNFSKPKKNEYFFVKNGFDAFFETDLNNFLQKKNIKTLYISGLLTGVCVLNSVFSAYNLGYRIYLIENCCTDRTKKRHKSIFQNYSNYLFIKENI